MSPREMAAHVYTLTGGKAWEPPEPKSRPVIRLIEDGYVRRVDGRCGFEAFKDAMLTWTDAAHAAFRSEAMTPVAIVPELVEALTYLMDACVGGRIKENGLAAYELSDTDRFWQMYRNAAAALAKVKAVSQ